MNWFYHPFSPRFYPYSAVQLCTILRENGVRFRLVQHLEDVKPNRGDQLLLSMIYSDYMSEYDTIATMPEWCRITIGGDCAVGYGLDHWEKRWRRRDITLVEGYGEPSLLIALRNRVVTKLRSRLDINATPVPDYSLIDLKKFDIGFEQQTYDLWKRLAVPESYEEWRTPYGIVYASRGCANNCSFCTTSMMYGNRYHHMELDRLELEILALKQQGVRWMIFFDTDFGSGRGKLEAMCRMLIDRKLGMWWDCEGVGRGWNEDTLSLMKEAGCFYIRFGLESASDVVREEYNKQRIKLEWIRSSVAAAKKVNLPTHVNLILGARCETDDTVQATIDFMNECGVDYYQVSPLTVYAGTALFKEVGKECVNPWHSPACLEDWTGRIKDRSSAKWEGAK